MATVTGLTAERMLAIEAASVVDGDVVGDNLILTQHGGTQINAGSVRGPAGPQGAVGQDLPILAAKPVLEVGIPGQIRAGRQLTAADFTNMGLSVPLGLWNLSDLTDVSGNGRALLNKGAVPFGSGINGLATTAAVFSGSTAQALYIPDTGAADPFRIRTGSFGCWFKSAKRGINQALFTRWSTTLAHFQLRIDTTNVLAGFASDGAGVFGGGGVAGVADDCWHFGVVTVDGSDVCLYLDGNLERRDAAPPMGSNLAPLNIGAMAADAATTASMASSARVDEAFITADVLSPDQIRMLYCAKIPHTLGAVPSRISLNVRRRRKGAVMTVADFSTQPVRLYNFSAGSLGDEGSNGAILSNGAGAVPIAGVDGTKDNAYNFVGNQALTSTDAGMPSGVTPRSYGCWFKSTNIVDQNIMAWGLPAGTSDARLSTFSGGLASSNGQTGMAGGFVCDGLWHQVILVADDAATDGLKSKLYLDGRLVNSLTGITAVVLGGANSFRIGANSAGGAPFIGQIDGVLIASYAMTLFEIQKLYAKGSQALAPSPKNVGDHVEALTATDILATFDSLPSQHLIDLTVAP